MLRVERTGAVLSTNEKWASSALDRMRGLREGPPIQHGEALVIPRARQVHTFGMAYAIDVVFCGNDWRVRHVIQVMQPGRITKWVRGGYYAVELPAGQAGGVVTGDKLVYSLSSR